MSGGVRETAMGPSRTVNICVYIYICICRTVGRTADGQRTEDVGWRTADGGRRTADGGRTPDRWRLLCDLITSSDSSSLQQLIWQSPICSLEGTYELWVAQTPYRLNIYAIPLKINRIECIQCNPMNSCEFLGSPVKSGKRRCCLCLRAAAGAFFY